jgi:hypothetical protein
MEAKIASFQKAIRPIIAKAGISALSRFLLGDHKALLEAFDAADIGNTIANALKGGFEEAEKSRQQIFEIKNALLELIVALDGKKILILIDELDRCRPDFAIEVLETVKHFLTVKGVFSVTGIYDKVLHSIIETRYGPQIVAEKYLERHFNHKMTFSKFNYEEYLISRFEDTNAIKKNWLIKSEEFDDGIICAAKYASQICEIGNFNLRQVNILINKIDSIISSKCVIKLSQAQDLGSKNLFGLTIAVFCKELDAEKFEVLVNSQSISKRKESISYFTQKAQSEKFVAYLITMISKDDAEYENLVEQILNPSSDYSSSFRPLLRKIKLACNDLVKFDGDGSRLN